MPIQIVSNQIKDAAVITAKIADSAVTPLKADLSQVWAFTALPSVNADPSANNDLCRKSYVDNKLSGLYWKEACRVMMTSNVNTSAPGATLDSIAMASGNRVLLTGQSTGTEDGIWVWNGAAASMTRATDADTYQELDSAATFIKEGTAADQAWVQSAELTGFGSQNWVQFSNTNGGRQAGTGMSLSGNTLNVDFDNSSIGVNGSDQLYVKASGITDAMLAGSITNAKLSNSSLSVASGNGLTGGGSVSLGGSTTVSVQADGSTLTVSGSGLKVSDAGIGATQIASNAVVEAKISDGAVTLDKLANLASASVLIGNGSNRPAAVAFSGDITVANTGAATIANNAVSSAKIADTAVTTAKLADLADGKVLLGNGTNRPAAVAFSGDITVANTGAATIANNAVSSAKIADGSVVLDKMANLASASFLVGNGSNRPAAVSLSGDATLANDGTMTIANNAVSSAKIADGAVVLDKLVNLTSARILLGNGSNRPAAVSLSGDLTLANDGTATIANTAISTAKIANSAVDASKLASNAVTSAKIASSSVSIAKLSYAPYADALTGSTATKYDLSQTVPAAFYAGIQVFRNGMRCKKVSSGPSDASEFTIAADGTGGITAVTFGSAPNGDSLQFDFYA